MNLSRLVVLHAELISEAREHERAAARMDRANETNGADLARDRAAEARERAGDLADLLEPHGVIRASDPRQLQLINDGSNADAR